MDGACTTTCNTGYAFDSQYGYCRNVQSDTKNCGSGRSQPLICTVGNYR